MDNYIVYKYTSPSGKIYIGQTSGTIKSRAGSNGVHYLSKNRNGEYTQPYIANAILKYGFDNFKKEILCEGLSREEANQKEKEFILLYNSTDRKYGYNIKSGGENFSDEDRINQSESMKKAWANPNSKYHTMIHNFVPTEEFKEKVSKILKQKYESMTEEELIGRCRALTKDPINQYDLDGNFVKQWLSMYELEQNGFNRHNINAVCKRRTTPKGYTISTYKGYQWRYSSDCDDIGKYERPKKYSDCKQFRKIALIDKNGEVIKEYTSIVEAADELNLNPNGITGVCRGRYKTTKGYIFKYI